MQVSPNFKYNQGRSSGFGQRLNEECICPICGFKIPFEAGVLCYNKSCPKCGFIMTVAK